MMVVKNNLKKSACAFCAVCLLLSVCSFGVFAANKNSEKVIGMVRSNIPYIQVEIKNNDIEKSDVSGRLGSEAVPLYSLDKIAETKSLTYVLIDNSTSMTKAHICPPGSFEKLKEGAKALISSQVDDKNNFAVYSIGKGDPKKLGEVIDKASAETVGNAVSALKGDEAGTNLNQALSDLFADALAQNSSYQTVKFLLITDSSADYSNGIAISEIDDLFQYNKIPIYTVCNTTSNNSEAFKQFRTISRNSGGEGFVYDYYSDSDASALLSTVYEEMQTGFLATFIANVPADNNTKEFVVNLKGTDYGETVKLDTAANIDAPVQASVQVNDSNNAFIIAFRQDGFPGNLPVNEQALNNSAYEICKAAKDKPLAVQKVERNTDGSYTVTMKEDIYSGNYDFRFIDITDLSKNANAVSNLDNVEIQAKNPFWRVFPYLMGVVCVAVVALLFYLILLKLKKKKNVKKIKELFITQVNETVEEKHYIQNVAPQSHPVTLYCQTANNPQRKLTLKVVSSFIVGRSNICEVCIEDAKMSRQHFAVEYTGGVFMISDLNSVNGTFVNGVRVLSRQRLNSGDMILAGLTRVRIEF